MSTVSPPRLDAMLSPRSIAIVGASNDTGKMGGRCLQYLLRHGYQGQVYPISRSQQTIQGLPAYQDVRDAPGPVDLAILAVGSDQVLGIVEHCGEAGVGGVIVLAAGFAELGADGRAAQERLGAIADRYGMLLCGPNSNGLVNINESVIATSNPALEHGIAAGGIGIVTQSGGLGLGSVLYLAHHSGVGVGSCVSTGNEARLELSDFLGHLVHDDRTSSIAAILEGIKTPAKFVAAAGDAYAADKPIVVLRVGSSQRGARMTESHTAILAGSGRNEEAVFKRMGVVQVAGVVELYETASLLGSGYRLGGRGVGVISPSGGAAILAADWAERAGVPLAELDASTIAALKGLLPDFVGLRNPLDLTASGTNSAQLTADCVEAVVRDPGVGVAICILTVSVNYDSLCESLLRLAEQTDKPIVAVTLGDGLNGVGVRTLDKGRVIRFSRLEDAFTAIRHLMDHERFRAAGPLAYPPAAGTGDGPALTTRSRWDGVTAINDHDALTWLGASGLDCARTVLAQSEDAAVAAFEQFGGPVVMKVVSPDVPHRGQAGLVRVGPDTADAVRTAYRDLVAGADAVTQRLDGIVVQELLRGQLELFCGVQVDERYGPIVLVGHGGTLVESLNAVALRAGPLRPFDAEAMLRDVPSLDRAIAAVDDADGSVRRAAVDFLVRLSRCTFDGIAELDVNPVLVGPGRAVALDALGYVRRPA